MSRIVIAEDDEVVVELVREAFAATSHIVGWLPDGESALEVMRQRPPALAILDCNLPGMSGIKVLREMRQSPDLCHVPVLMLTGRLGSRMSRSAVTKARTAIFASRSRPTF